MDKDDLATQKKINEMLVQSLLGVINGLINCDRGLDNVGQEDISRYNDILDIRENVEAIIEIINKEDSK